MDTDNKTAVHMGMGVETSNTLNDQIKTLRVVQDDEMTQAINDAHDDNNISATKDELFSDKEVFDDTDEDGKKGRRRRP